MIVIFIFFSFMEKVMENPEFFLEHSNTYFIWLVNQGLILINLSYLADQITI